MGSCYTGDHIARDHMHIHFNMYVLLSTYNRSTVLKSTTYIQSNKTVYGVYNMYNNK